MTAPPATRAAAAGALLLAALTGCGGEPEPPANLLLVTLDTTRADFLGCYGRREARTATLDALAAQGTLFEHASASHPVTQPSHSTILTGLYPMAHGVRDNTWFHLPDGVDTLAEILARRGWATGAAVGGFPLVREFGTAQGFDFYDDDLEAPKLGMRGEPVPFASHYDERPAGHVNDALRPWLRRRADEPFFAWVHYWDPHHPHIAPAPWGQLFAHDPYQGEIAYADASLGALLDELEALGVAERTLVVVTADHGEGRLEHGEITHAFLAYESTLHVPLIVRGPGLPVGVRVTERVGTVDIVPTVLDLLGVEPAAGLQGRSLAPLLGGSDAAGDAPHPYYAESLSPRLTHGFGELRVLYRGPWKYIHGPRPELFHLGRDPGELADLVAEEPGRAARMEATLGRLLAHHAAAGAAAEALYDAPPETRRRLAALGYLAAEGAAPSAPEERLRDDGAPPQDRVVHMNRRFRLRAQLAAGRFEAVRRTARELLATNPGHPYYRATLASAHLGLGELDAAARLAEGAERLGQPEVATFFEVARALAEDGREERGVALARRLLAAEETADGRLALARMLRRSGDEAGYRTQVGRALELDPEHRGARLALADHLLAVGRPEDAAAEYRGLLARRPADPVALAGLERADRRLAQPEPAPEAGGSASLVVATWEGGRVALPALREALAHRLLPACREVRRRPAGGTVEETVACYRELASELALERTILAAVPSLPAGLAEVGEAWEEIRGRALLQAWRARLRSEVEAEVDDAEVAAFHAEHRERYRRPGELSLWSIFRRHRDAERPEETLELLRGLRRRALDGESFEALARRHSDSETRARGGRLGRVEEGRLARRLEEAAFALPEGGISEPLPVAGGAVLLHARDIVPGEDPPLERVADTVRRDLVAATVSRRMEERAAALRLPEGATEMSLEELAGAVEAGAGERVALAVAGIEIGVAELARAARVPLGLPPGADERGRLASARESQRERLLLIADLRSSAAPELAAEAEEAARAQGRSRLVEAHMRRRILASLDADPARLRTWWEDNPQHYRSPLRFHLEHLEVPLGEDPPARLERLEGMRAELTAGRLELAAVAERLGGRLRDLGWGDFDSFGRVLPAKARAYLANVPAGGYSVPYQEGRALHLLRVRDRREPRPQPFEEVREEVRDDYFARYRRDLYREARDARLEGLDFRFHEEALRRRLDAAGEGGASERFDGLKRSR